MVYNNSLTNRKLLIIYLNLQSFYLHRLPCMFVETLDTFTNSMKYTDTNSKA